MVVRKWQIASVALLGILVGGCDGSRSGSSGVGDAGGSVAGGEVGVDAGDTGIEAGDLGERDAGEVRPMCRVDVGFERPSEPPEIEYDRKGATLRDDRGRAMTLHGVNVSNHMKRDPERVTWHEKRHFEDIARKGFNNVRLLTTWDAIMPKRGKIDRAYLDAYAKRVEWAADAGLTVVVDMHQDVFGYGFGGDGAPEWACDSKLYQKHRPRSPWWRNYESPQVQKCFDRFYRRDERFAKFVRAWVAMARRVGDHPAVVGFDLLNEPHWGTAESSQFVEAIWQERLEQLAAALRRVAPERIVFFEGPPLASFGFVDDWDRACDGRTAFAPHYYHPRVHEGDPYRDEYASDIEDGFEAIDEMADELGGVPVWVGEFGAPESAGGMEAYLAEMLERMAERRWSWAVWSDDKGDGFGLRRPDASFEAFVDLLVHPYLRRTPGRIVEQRLSFEKGRYEAVVEWGIDAPMTVWRGPKGNGGRPSLTVEPIGDGDPIRCAQKRGAPAGVVACPSPAEADGARYRVRVEWPGD